MSELADEWTRRQAREAREVFAKQKAQEDAWKALETKDEEESK